MHLHQKHPKFYILEKFDFLLEEKNRDAEICLLNAARIEFRHFEDCCSDRTHQLEP